MASESTSPEDDHGHADGTASRTFAPSGVSAQVTGGGTNAGDRTATPLLQEVPRNGATASTIRAIPDDDDPPIPVWQVADHEKEWKGPQLHDGPAGPQPFFSHEFDDSLAKRGGDDLEGPQLHDGLPGPPPCFPHEFDDSLAKRGRNAAGGTPPPLSPALVREPGHGVRAEPQGPRQPGTSRRRLPRESLVLESQVLAAGGRGAAAEIGPQGLTQLEAECTALLQGQSDESLPQANLVPEDQLIQGYNVNEPVYIASELSPLPMVEVVAPSDLPEGYVFDAVENGKSFSVTVPAGGVSRGQTFSAPFVPWEPSSRRWKDGLFDCFAFGCCHPALWMGCCCRLALLGQVQNRLGLNWLGGRANPGNESPFKVLLGITIFDMVWSGLFSSPALYRVKQAFNFAMSIFSIYVILKTRKHIRESSGIPEQSCQGCEDCCCATWCGCCTVLQMARHTADYEYYEASYPGQWCYPGQCCSETGLPYYMTPQLQFGGTEIV